MQCQTVKPSLVNGPFLFFHRISDSNEQQPNERIEWIQLNSLLQGCQTHTQMEGTQCWICSLSLVLIEPVGWFEITMEKINSWFLTNIPYGYFTKQWLCSHKHPNLWFCFQCSASQKQSWITFDLRKCTTIMGS